MESLNNNAADPEALRDITGRYYDELTQEEKIRFWRYTYSDNKTAGEVLIKKAERIEKFISGTLHFICELKPEDFELPEIDELNKSLEEVTI